MKNVKSLSILLIITGIFNSCNNDIIFEDTLEGQLNHLQEKVLIKDFDIIDRSIRNFDFFQEIDLMRKSKSPQVTGAFQRKYQSMKDQERINLSKNETLFYENFSASLNLSEMHFLEVTQLYLNNIEKLHLSMEEKKRATEGLSFLKDLMIFLDFDPATEQPIKGIYWSWDCPRRDCWDCCMYYKSMDLMESNWIEKAAFLASAPQHTAVWAASCGWDCITENYE